MGIKSRILTLIGGIAIGVAGTTAAIHLHRSTDGFQREMVNAEVGATALNLTVLRLLRDDETNSAIDMLETGLSMNAMVLNEWVKMKLTTQNQNRAEKALVAISRYRDKFAYQLDSPEADDEVARILADYREK